MTIGVSSSSCVTRRQLVGGPEQERPVDAEDRHVVGDRLVLQRRARGRGGCSRASRATRWSWPTTRRMNSSAAMIIPASTATVRSASTVSANVTQPDDPVGPSLFPELGDLAPLAHVVGDDEQNGREHGHRHRAGQRRGEQQDDEQRAGVNHSGNRSPRARANVRRGPARWLRSRAGRRPAATRCWRCPARTARRSSCASSCSCDRRRRPTAATRWRRAWRSSASATAASGRGPARNRGMRTSGRPAGMPPKRMPIVSSGRPAIATTSGAADERDDVTRDARHQPVPDDDQRQDARGHQRRRQRRGVGVHRELGHPRNQLAGHRALQRDAEEVLDLRAGDHQGDAVGEADHHRPRDEADRGSRCRSGP